MIKNIITIDIDESRKDSPILVIKPEGSEANIEHDIATLCEGICTLIHVGQQQLGKDSAHMLKSAIKHLEDGFADATYKVE